ncbi:hypothetical protein ACH4T9_13005 [Micromonospora sp. NPDC020750]|uniref:hypothetical protein n=1 Tax=unclassified Micromonospora TaxID=2617518 RepID=UPI0037B9C8D7
MAKPMPNQQVLDVMVALFWAAEHPDYTNLTRYGRDPMPGGQSPAGVKATHMSGSTLMLWAAAEPRDAKPVGMDESMLTCMPGRTLRLAHLLLDAARPEQFVSWQLCAAPGVGWPTTGESPSAIRIAGRDGSIAYLRATAASGPRGGAAEPKTDPCPDYQIPQGVLECHHGQSAAPAEPLSV